MIPCHSNGVSNVQVDAAGLQIQLFETLFTSVEGGDPTESGPIKSFP